jgi:hypothetical protein
MKCGPEYRVRSRVSEILGSSSSSLGAREISLNLKSGTSGTGFAIFPACQGKLALLRLSFYCITSILLARGPSGLISFEYQ